MTVGTPRKSLLRCDYANTNWRQYSPSRWVITVRTTTKHGNVFIKMCKCPRTQYFRLYWFQLMQKTLEMFHCLYYYFSRCRWDEAAMEPMYRGQYMHKHLHIHTISWTHPMDTVVSVFPLFYIISATSVTFITYPFLCQHHWKLNTKPSNLPLLIHSPAWCPCFLRWCWTHSGLSWAHWESQQYVSSGGCSPPGYGTALPPRPKGEPAGAEQRNEQVNTLENKRGAVVVWEEKNTEDAETIRQNKGKMKWEHTVYGRTARCRNSRSSNLREHTAERHI